MKRAIVIGAGGFLGNAMTKRLKAEGYFVRGVDRKKPDFEPSSADQFFIADVTRHDTLYWHRSLLEAGGSYDFAEVYQFAANMGGMGFLGDAANDAQTLRDNALINLRVLDACVEMGNRPKLFFASSACVYPYEIRKPMADGLWGYENSPGGFKECDAYPAYPDLEYGWEKLFSERLYASYALRYQLPIRIGRFHNIYGLLGTWDGGREKAPAAICRKVAMAKLAHWPEIEVWGDGQQQRSFCYVDDAVEGTWRLMQSDFTQPLNIGSAEMVPIDTLVDLVCQIADVHLEKRYVAGPQGVRGRNSDNTLIQKKLGWQPSISLRVGLEQTYAWIEQQVRLTKAAA